MCFQMEGHIQNVRFGFVVLLYLLDGIRPTVSASTTPTVTEATTLVSELKLYDHTTVYILAGVFLAAIPIIILLYCLARSLCAHRRQQKITDESEEDSFQHPPPSHPPPKPFLHRDNTIAGPFNNPAFDDGEDADGRSDVVTPSFISTRVVNEADVPKRFKYIP